MVVSAAALPTPTATDSPVATGIPRILSIAGSDPSGGAGIQADLKSISALGGYGMAAITALTAQNTHGVRAVHVPPAEFLRSQLQAISDDIELDAVKIGMLADSQVIGVVRDWLREHRPPVIVLDPVMVASSGDRLLDAEAEEALRELVHLADLVTPNLPELGVLMGEAEPGDWAAALRMAQQLADAQQTRVLLKGGHLSAGPARDALLVPGEQPVVVELPRLQTSNTHGTGCSFSAAIATCQARNGDWAQSLAEAKDWLHAAVARGAELRVGSGLGPVHHFHRWHPAPVTDDWWRRIEPIRAGILELPFIRGLAAGTLPEPEFSYYLAQDARYLNGYSRALARASALAPDERQQAFWARGAANCLDVEAELHRTWLQKHPASLLEGPVTKKYVDHLLAASGSSYAVLVAAVLPCYWLYSWAGKELAASRSLIDPHPYGAWLDTYADEEFAAATEQAIEFAAMAAARVDGAERELMWQAFQAASQYELELFDAPRAALGQAGSGR